VVDGKGRLVGVFTDGDLRRRLAAHSSTRAIISKKRWSFSIHLLYRFPAEKARRETVLVGAVNLPASPATFEQQFHHPPATR
jgi:CBS domain-containing protein